LKLTYDKLLSSYAFKFNLRRYIEGHLRNFDPDVAKYGPRIADASIELHGRGLHSSTSELHDLIRVRHKTHRTHPSFPLIPPNNH